MSAAPSTTVGSPRGRWALAASRRLNRSPYPVYLLVPALAFIVAFYVVPNLLNFVYSFTDWSTYKDQVNYVGARNFSDLASESELTSIAWTTVKYALIVVVVENVVALGLALALEDDTKMNVVLRTVFFIPVLLSPLAAGYVFKSIFATDGTLNGALETISGDPVNVEWLGSVSFTLVVLALVHSWKWGGIHMLVYLAALKTIPRELTEAARIEGASAWRTFWSVRLRLLAPAFTFNITLTLVGALATVDIALAMTSGGPGRSTTVLTLFILQQYGTGAFGYATALSLVLFLLIVAISIPLITALRRLEVEL